jgi:hypothetical protein
MGGDGDMSDLASVIIGEPADTERVPQLRQGVVTQSSPLLVRVGSSTTATPCNALASYTPSVGDVVSVLVLSGDRLVLGAVGAQASGLPYRGTFTVSQGASLPAGGFTQFTSTATLTIPPGHLVVCRWYIRAIAGSPSGGVTFRVGMLKDGTVQGDDNWNTNISSSQWASLSGLFEIVGDGASHTYALAYQTNASVLAYPTIFHISEA